MSRVFWDSMLFIYLVEDHPEYAPVTRRLLARCFERNDTLYTSHLSIAETLVGVAPGSEKELRFLSALQRMGFIFVEFGGSAIEPFRSLRRDFKLRPPDSMNLACAASVQTDIFLTFDAQLLAKRLHVPGIQFIADFTKAPL